MSEETAIKQKNSIKWRKPQVFNPDFLHKDKKHGRSRDFSLLLPFFCLVMPKCDSPSILFDLGLKRINLGIFLVFCLVVFASRTDLGKIFVKIHSVVRGNLDNAAANV